jgi:hypothetical protein
MTQSGTCNIRFPFVLATPCPLTALFFFLREIAGVCVRARARTAQQVGVYIPAGTYFR